MSKNRQDSVKWHYFILFSNDLQLGKTLLTIYKNRNIVEEGFRALKSNLEITPEYHSKDQRIKTHTIMVVCGYLLLAILRTLLHARGKKYTLPTLKKIITTGHLTTGYYQLKEKGNYQP